MKKLIVLLTAITCLAACSKNDDDDNPIISAKATIDYLGDPALGSFGWTLRTGNTFEVPTNLPDSLKQDELNVNVTYKKSDQFFPCRCVERKQMVDIISITRD